MSAEEEEKITAAVKDLARFVCITCGWVYDPEEGDPEGGIAPGTAFEDIPEDWTCPACGVGKEFFEKADEKAQQTLLGGLFGGRFQFISDGTIPYGSFLNNDSLFKIQSDVIRELAENQSCLFVGRCADYILRDHPRHINIFISASKEARIERLMQLNNITAEQAEERARADLSVHLAQPFRRPLYLRQNRRSSSRSPG